MARRSSERLKVLDMCKKIKFFAFSPKWLNSKKWIAWLDVDAAYGCAVSCLKSCSELCSKIKNVHPKVFDLIGT